MFQLKRVSTFKHRIDVEIPTEDPNKTQRGSFVVTFRKLDRTALDALAARKLTDPEYIDEVVIAVEGIQDENGDMVSSEDAIAAIKADLALAGGLIRGFLEATAGAVGKNSLKSRG